MSEKVWRIEIDGRVQGPYTELEIKQALLSKKISGDTLVYGPGMVKWEPIDWLPQFAPDNFKSKASTLPKPTFHRQQLVHDIEFEISGTEMQYVEVVLDPNEAVVAEAGTFMYADAGIAMKTIFGDGSDENKGVLDSLLGAGKRLLTGESLFMTTFTNHSHQTKKVAFAAPYPGRIIPVNLAELGGEVICQKDSFLCAAKGVSIGIAFQKKIGVALFGGEGFVMQRLQGDGLAFIHAGGALMSRELEPGETLSVDTGCLVAHDRSVAFDIKYVGSVKSAIFGGESFFLAQLTGPGTVWLQSMPFGRLVGRIGEIISGARRAPGEGSVIGDISRVFER